MPRARVAGRSMTSAETGSDPEATGIAEIVPARAVLTELARGFLLVHATDRDHAVRFAAGFLREQAGRGERPRVEPVQKVTLARLSLGRHYRGAVEPPGLPGPR
jgi:hypothetical protein